jgi:hypothetical protein
MAAAKSEAEAEIADLRSQREAHYQKDRSSQISDATRDSDKLVEQSKKEISAMESGYNAKKSAVEDMLVKLVTTVNTDMK